MNAPPVVILCSDPVLTTALPTEPTRLFSEPTVRESVARMVRRVGLPETVPSLPGIARTADAAWEARQRAVRAEAQAALTVPFSRPPTWQVL